MAAWDTASAIPKSATIGQAPGPPDRAGWRRRDTIHVLLDLFVGGLGGQQIARLTLDGQEVTREETLLHDLGRVRDVRQGPDGFIYLAIDDRRGGSTPIVRLEPVGR